MAPAGQRNRCLAAHDSEDEQKLPSFDGTLTNLNSWLDDLNDSEHLLEAEVVTLLHTGCAISRSGRTVACSRAHAHLKGAGILDGAGFGVLAPPPLDDGFAAYYDQVQAEIKKKDPKHSADVCKRFSELQPKPAKDDDDTPKENDKIGIVEINPDLVAQVDQKLLSQLLKLITEKGARARYVKEARRSGVRLLRLLIATAAETTTSFGADPRLVRNLRRLRELKDRTLSAVSQVEFDTLRYALERANESLPPNHRDTHITQMQSHMLGLVRRLGDPIFETYLENQIKERQLRDGEYDKTILVITTALVKHAAREESLVEGSRRCARELALTLIVGSSQLARIPGSRG